MLSQLKTNESKATFFEAANQKSINFMFNDYY